MEQFDGYTGSQITVSTNSGTELVKIIGQKQDHQGKLIGTKHETPALDSCIYIMRYPNEHFEQYYANS